MGKLASNFYDNPSSKLKLVGVTGTNGKTTIATLLYKLFRSLGYKAGLFSTVRNFVNDKVYEATHTTPDPVRLNSLFNEMVEQGCDFVFMEVSSHAIVQNRVTGLDFKGGIFTNITHDHLDYHSTFDNYLTAKKKFFDQLPEETFALVNIDDKHGKVMVQNTKAKIYSYALKTMADFKAKIIENLFEGMHLNIDNIDIWTKLIGEFNAYNLLAIYGCALLLGEDKEEVLRIISNLEAVDGRFNYVRSNDGVTAIVDYAHTPDALENVLNTINQIRTGKNQLITVVGAGGDRDKAKRPKMARVAADKSNKIILTSDNPRTESPEAIIDDMIEGLDNKDNLKKVLIIVDRREAIKTACMLAKRGDIILIAGKGHETYQEINGVRTHFSDKEIVEEQFLIKKINTQ